MNTPRQNAVRVHNVSDRRRDWIGSWETEPLSYQDLSVSDIGRSVIYRDHGRAEAGTLSSFRNGIVFARYGKGDTAAGANPQDLVFGVRALEGPSLELAHSDELSMLIIEATERGITVKTEFVYPPIPIRSMDWSAIDDRTYDGEGCPIGRGSTELEAVRDLLEQIEERS